MNLDPLSSPVDLNSTVDKLKLAKLVLLDPHVEKETKENILSFLNGPDPVGHLLAGSAGALVAANISQFLNMKKETQILLSLAGFGAGVIISNYIVHNSPYITTEKNKTILHP